MPLPANSPARLLPGLLLLALGCASGTPPTQAPASSSTAALPAASATAAVKKYIVMIEGRNLILASGGRPQRFGFSATRDVEAHSPEEAAERAIRTVREDAELHNALLNDPSDPPRFVVTQNVQVESFESHRRPDRNYIFYTDRDTR
jgi:hypothetical protein